MCPTCGQETPEARNFCIHCKHKIRNLNGVIRLGAGCRRNPKVETFWETGDPSVFAQPAALDFNPRLG